MNSFSTQYLKIISAFLQIKLWGKILAVMREKAKQNHFEILHKTAFIPKL
jgi:hypothetical protein